MTVMGLPDCSGGYVYREVRGLEWASERLRGKISDIALLEFTRGEIVRNPIIGEMLKYLEN
jgi:phosphate starvation-inducible protein PhoH